VRWVGVAAATALLASCGSGQQRSASQWQVDTHAGAPSRAKEPSAVVRGKIGPGTFVTTKSNPTITFTLDGSWITISETPDTLFLADGTAATGSVQLEFVKRSAITVAVDPTRTTGLVNVSPSAQRAMRGTPIDEIRSIPDLEVEKGPMMDVAGKPRQTYLVRSTLPGSTKEACGVDRCRQLPTAAATEFYALGPQEESTVIDLPDEDLWIFLGDVTTDSTGARRKVAPILASLRIDQS